MNTAGWLFLLLLITVAALAGGVLLIVFSGRRAPGHWACGKCGYNVHGSIGSVTRCPECGADFGQAGITPPGGNRKRNPFMIAAGVVLIVSSLGCLGPALLLPLAARAQRSAAQKAAAAQPAPAPADAAQPETAEDTEGD